MVGSISNLIRKSENVCFNLFIAFLLCYSCAIRGLGYRGVYHAYIAVVHCAIILCSVVSWRLKVNSAFGLGKTPVILYCLACLAVSLVVSGNSKAMMDSLQEKHFETMRTEYDCMKVLHVGEKRENFCSLVAEEKRMFLCDRSYFGPSIKSCNLLGKDISEAHLGINPYTLIMGRILSKHPVAGDYAKSFSEHCFVCDTQTNMTMVPVYMTGAWAEQSMWIIRTACSAVEEHILVGKIARVGRASTIAIQYLTPLAWIVPGGAAVVSAVSGGIFAVSSLFQGDDLHLVKHVLPIVTKAAGAVFRSLRPQQKRFVLRHALSFSVVYMVNAAACILFSYVGACPNGGCALATAMIEIAFTCFCVWRYASGMNWPGTCFWCTVLCMFPFFRAEVAFALYANRRMKRLLSFNGNNQYANNHIGLIQQHGVQFPEKDEDENIKWLKKCFWDLFDSVGKSCRSFDKNMAKLYRYFVGKRKEEEPPKNNDVPPPPAEQSQHIIPERIESGVSAAVVVDVPWVPRRIENPEQINEDVVQARLPAAPVVLAIEAPRDEVPVVVPLGGAPVEPQVPSGGGVARKVKKKRILTELLSEGRKLRKRLPANRKRRLEEVDGPHPRGRGYVARSRAS